MLKLALQIIDRQRNPYKGCGVRIIDADTPEQFDAEVERIMREEPPAPGYGYLFVPRQLSMQEWVAKYGGPVTHRTRILQ